MRAFIAVKKILEGKEVGVGLIETLVALALLGLIAAPLLNGLFIASKATLISDKRATAESLARSQIEYVKKQDYINYADPEHGSYTLISTPANYTILISTTPIDPATAQALPSGQDNGVQKIEVEARLSGEPVLTIEDYKVNR